MAPEVFIQNTLYSEKADVFRSLAPTSILMKLLLTSACSFGLCVNETISQQVPFEHLNPGTMNSLGVSAR